MKNNQNKIVEILSIMGIAATLVPIFNTVKATPTLSSEAYTQWYAEVTKPAANTEYKENKIPTVSMKLNRLAEVWEYEDQKVNAVLTVSDSLPINIDKITTQKIQSIEIKNPSTAKDVLLNFANVPLMFSGDNYIGCMIEVYKGNTLMSSTNCLDKTKVDTLAYKVKYNGKSQSVPVFRYWSPLYQTHVYIENLDEKKAVDANTEWQIEQVEFFTGHYDPKKAECSVKGQTALHRLYSANYRAHFYTMSAGEASEVSSKDPNWTYEGWTFCAYKNEVDGSKAVHRFWSPEYLNHAFISNEAEKDHIIKNYPTSTWKYEGIGYYVLK